MPKTASAAATSSTMNRLRTDSSIRRSIMGGSLALRGVRGLPRVHLPQGLVRLVEGFLVAALAADEHGPALHHHLDRRAHDAQRLVRDRADLLLLGERAIGRRQPGERGL